MSTYSSSLQSSQVRVEIDVFGQEFRYTNWSGVVAGFTSVPALAVREVQYYATLRDDTAEVIIPARDDDGLTALLGPLQASGTIANAKIRVVEVLVDENGAAQATRPLFSGIIETFRENYRKKKGQSGLICRTTKGFANVPGGYTCSEFCPHALGDDLCGVDTSSFNQTATISAFDSETRTATVLGFSTPTDKTFSRGSLFLGGLRIMVRSWTSSNPSQFPLSRPIPLVWVGAQVTLEPGCEKTKQVCDDVYSNLDNNGAIGRKMLSYDPSYQLPDEC